MRDSLIQQIGCPQQIPFVISVVQDQNEILGPSVKIEGCDIGRWCSLNGVSLCERDFSGQLPGNRLRNFTLNCKKVSHIPIVGLRPHVCVGARLDELCVDSEPIADSLNTAFQEMSNAKLLAYLTRVARIFTFIKVRRSATDNFQVGNSCQVRQNFILHAGREVGILLVVAEILEWQHCDALLGNPCKR